MPVNPDIQPGRIEQARLALATKWYWFTVNHSVSDILAAFFFGVLVGLWVS